MRGLPRGLRTVLEQLPADAHPMDVMRTGCSALGCLEPEHDFSQQQDIADRLLAALRRVALKRPGMVGLRPAAEHVQDECRLFPDPDG